MYDSLTLQPVAVIHTPYKEKFSIPRQPNLVQDGTGIVELLSPYNQAEAVRGLEQFSHLWLIFQFDQNPARQMASYRAPATLRRQSTGWGVCLALYTSPESYWFIQSGIAPRRM